MAEQLWQASVVDMVIHASLCAHSQGGIFVFQLLDYYGCNGACLLCVAMAECIAVGWAFGRLNLGYLATLNTLVFHHKHNPLDSTQGCSHEVNIDGGDQICRRPKTTKLKIS